ncbi:MAG: hypothetical protein P8J85_08210, partial [Alphaproteobacteria bacterium]|nr:hypothetical protein [Alphaproteobacteria bacterium]
CLKSSAEVHHPIMTRSGRKILLVLPGCLLRSRMTGKVSDTLELSWTSIYNAASRSQRRNMGSLKNRGV